jgi:hypothetical protein
MAQAIGQVINLESNGTALPQRFDTSRMDHLLSLSELTVSECDELRAIALAMPTEHIPVETRELARQLQFIDATLPSKNVEEQSGQMRTAVYARILGGYTKDALSYMTERVCRELDWFPTPRQCLEILADYRPRATKKDIALRICAKHTQARFDQWIAALRTGGDADIEGVPDGWLEIAETQGFLRFNEGVYERRK